MLDVAVKQCDSIRCFFIVNVVVGVDKLLVNRFDSFDSLTTWVKSDEVKWIILYST